MGDGLSRRNLIKGAAAAGVGIAVWSAPSISTLGVTPAYAAVCTIPFTFFTSGDRNTSCDCQGAIAYHFPITPNVFTPDAGGPAIAFTIDSSPNHQNKICSDCAGDPDPCSSAIGIPVSITGPSVNGVPVWDCQISKITIAYNNSATCSTPQGSIPGNFFSGKQALPYIQDPNNCCPSSKWSIQLQCVPHGTCQLT